MLTPCCMGPSQVVRTPAYAADWATSLSYISNLDSVCSGQPRVESCPAIASICRLEVLAWIKSKTLFWRSLEWLIAQRFGSRTNWVANGTVGIIWLRGKGNYRFGTRLCSPFCHLWTSESESYEAYNQTWCLFKSATLVAYNLKTERIPKKWYLRVLQWMIGLVTVESHAPVLFVRDSVWVLSESECYSISILCIVGLACTPSGIATTP